MAGQADLSDDGGMSDWTSPTPEIAARMKKARVDAGLTQEQAAELIGVSRTAVTMWENKRKPALPETFRLQRIEQVYGCSMAYLLQGDADNDDGPTRAAEPTANYVVTTKVAQLADNLRQMWISLPDDERRRFYDQIALAYGIATINQRTRRS
jgi:transcriptional regulator with XRE-family HTH domain